MSVPVLSWSFYAGGNRRPAPVKAPVGSLGARHGAQPPRPNTCALEHSLPHVHVVAQGHPLPDPQSQSFSRSYGSILPTSLIYILLLTRGYTPWRPDAVMSTPGGANTTRCSNFHGPSAAHQTRGKPTCFTSASTPSPGKPIPGSAVIASLLTRKDNSSWDCLRRLRARLRYRASTSRPRNINRVPFR